MIKTALLALLLGACSAGGSGSGHENDPDPMGMAGMAGMVAPTMIDVCAPRLRYDCTCDDTLEESIVCVDADSPQPGLRAFLDSGCPGTATCVPR